VSRLNTSDRQQQPDNPQIANEAKAFEVVSAVDLVPRCNEQDDTGCTGPVGFTDK
jgi:hypothetical protein